MKQRRFKSKFPRTLRKLSAWYCLLDEAPGLVGRHVTERGLVAFARQRRPRAPMLSRLFAASRPAPYRRRRRST